MGMAVAQEMGKDHNLCAYTGKIYKLGKRTHGEYGPVGNKRRDQRTCCEGSRGGGLNREYQKSPTGS